MQDKEKKLREHFNLILRNETFPQNMTPELNSIIQSKVNYGVVKILDKPPSDREEYITKGRQNLQHLIRYMKKNSQDDVLNENDFHLAQGGLCPMWPCDE